jgi:hypothetical protein
VPPPVETLHNRGHIVGRSAHGNGVTCGASPRSCEDPRVLFVPEDFEPPARLATERFELEPLAPEHNERDYEAWSSSIEHIRATPGFEDRNWPRI